MGDEEGYIDGVVDGVILGDNEVGIELGRLEGVLVG